MDYQEDWLDIERLRRYEAVAVASKVCHEILEPQLSGAKQLIIIEIAQLLKSVAELRYAEDTVALKGLRDALVALQERVRGVDFRSTQFEITDAIEHAVNIGIRAIDTAGMGIMDEIERRKNHFAFKGMFFILVRLNPNNRSTMQSWLIYLHNESGRPGPTNVDPTRADIIGGWPPWDDNQPVSPDDIWV